MCPTRIAGLIPWGGCHTGDNPYYDECIGLVKRLLRSVKNPSADGQKKTGVRHTPAITARRNGAAVQPLPKCSRIRSRNRSIREMRRSIAVLTIAFWSGVNVA